MRIVGGYLRGKKIFDSIDKSTRPLKDIVRESIFNVLEHSKNESVDLKEAKVLDLFSGIGGFSLGSIAKTAATAYGGPVAGIAAETAVNSLTS